MYNGKLVALRKIDNAELKRFCDMVGLVVLDAVDEHPEKPENGDFTVLAERHDDGAPVGCIRVDEFSAEKSRCSMNYYLCKEYEYDEAFFSDIILAMLKSLFAEFDVESIVCRHVKKIFGRQMLIPEMGFVVEVLNSCVNPNGELLVQLDYVMHREEYMRRYGDR